MTPEQYIKDCTRTEPDYDTVKTRLTNEDNARVLHACFGLTTESAELVDALKKHFFYGKPLDVVNLKEEAGDLLWYTSVLLDYLGVSYEEIMEKNIAKLKKRYGEKFSEDKAIHRNHEEEMKVYE